MNPAIVVVAYNRHESLKRILYSISNANYTACQAIPLLISIDKNDNSSVYETAEKCQWPYGNKEILAHKKHLGLREHILRCGDLTERYGSIILLEDDLFVSPFFYKYSVDALDFYRDDESIAGISLYNYRFNETARRPFEPIHDGHDVYFVQTASSWGQAWNYRQWQGFKKWYNSNEGTISSQDFLPSNVLAWPETSWKKYFIKYMVVNDKYFVYPRISLTTNFGDAGTHHKKDISFLQVPILMNKMAFRFVRFNGSLAIYDSFFELLPSMLLGYNNQLENYADNLEIDLYGTKEISKVRTKYILTNKKSNNVILSFSRILKPHEVSTLLNNKGITFKLVEVSNVSETRSSKSHLDSNLFDVPFISIRSAALIFWGKVIKRLTTLIKSLFS